MTVLNPKTQEEAIRKRKSPAEGRKRRAGAGGNRFFPIASKCFFLVFLEAVRNKQMFDTRV